MGGLRMIRGLQRETSNLLAIMKPDIHPDYQEVNVTCSCGNTFTTRSTYGNDAMSIDVCSQCHPFFTGKQKIVDTAGQVDKFRKRYGKKS